MPKAFKVKSGHREYFRCAVLLPGGGRRWVQARTKREAEAKANEQLRRLRLGLEPKTTNETLADFMERFLQFVKPTDTNEFGVSPSTYQDYRYHVSAHIVPALGRKRVGELSTRDVDAFLRAKAESNLAPATVEYIHRVLRRALNFAVDWNVIDRNPASARMRTAKRRRPGSEKADKIRFFTPDQAKLFLTSIHDDRLQALFVTALTTGARPGELFGLQWRDVNLESGRITICRALHRTKRRRGEEQERWILRAPKTAGSRRGISIPPITVEVLRQHQAEQNQINALAVDRRGVDDFVFTSERGTPLDVSNVLHRFQRICKGAGLPHLRLYDLRHTHASLLISQGMHPKLIAERLGHSSIKVTMDTYGHLFEGSDREAAGAMERVLGPEIFAKGESVRPNVTSISSKRKAKES
jgi:integrase